MKTLKFTAFTFGFLALITSFSSCCRAKQILYTKPVTICYTRSYCGGARPTNEMIEALNTPLVLSNCSLVFREKNYPKKKSPSFTTQINGLINLNLIPGTYIVSIGDNSKNKTELPFQKDCKKLSEKQLLEINFPYTENDTLVIKIPCNPCDSLLHQRR
jgi:hypothetical protein